MFAAGDGLWPWLVVFVILAAVLGPVATLRYLARIEGRKSRKRDDDPSES